MAPFENATYGLGVGEILGIVETDSGVHTPPCATRRGDETGSFYSLSRRTPSAE